MADTRITDLAVLTGAALAANDPFVVVDVSDLSMAVSGTNKRIDTSDLATGLHIPHSLEFGAGSVSSTTTTRYLWPGFEGGIAQIAPVQFRLTRAGTLKSLRVHHNSPAGNGNNIVYTVRKNGVATTLTCTLASTAADGSDLVNSVSFAAGDLVDIRITKGASVGAAPNDVTATVEVAY